MAACVGGDVPEANSQGVVFGWWKALPHWVHVLVLLATYGTLFATVGPPPFTSGKLAVCALLLLMLLLTVFLTWRPSDSEK